MNSTNPNGIGSYNDDIFVLVFSIYLLYIIMVGVLIYYNYLYECLSRLCRRDRRTDIAPEHINTPNPSPKPKPVSSYKDRKPANLTIETDIEIETELE